MFFFKRLNCTTGAMFLLVLLLIVNVSSINATSIEDRYLIYSRLEDGASSPDTAIFDSTSISNEILALSGSALGVRGDLSTGSVGSYAISNSMSDWVYSEIQMFDTISISESGSSVDVTVSLDFHAELENSGVGFAMTDTFVRIYDITDCDAWLNIDDYGIISVNPEFDPLLSISLSFGVGHEDWYYNAGGNTLSQSKINTDGRWYNFNQDIEEEFQLISGHEYGIVFFTGSMVFRSVDDDGTGYGLADAFHTGDLMIGGLGDVEYFSASGQLLADTYGESSGSPNTVPVPNTFILLSIGCLGIAKLRKISS